MQLESIPRVRSPKVALGGVPRHWFGGNVVATHVANGVNLLFPAGERFFIRSVRHYLDRIEDQELRLRIKGFFGQEGRHSKEHDDFNQILEEQGYEVQRFLALYERIAYGFIERVSPPSLRLSATAACEHFTAMLAENALRMRFLDIADPKMRALLLWHAAEEIEHRSVAYDVLGIVAPSYGMRVAGLAVAAACLGGFWAAGTLHLLAQERRLGSKASLRNDWKTMREYRSSLGERRFGRRADGTPTLAGGFVFLEGIKQYLRPDFHPSQSDVDRLASEYLASVGLA